ncbi:MAG: hypothetical protein ACHQ1G_09085, partial [Planctomycetota bacterium]
MRAAAALLFLGALVLPARADDPVITEAIKQLTRDDKDSNLAERTLKGLPDRAQVIEEAERVLEDKKLGIRGKRRVLLMLSRLERGDLVAKALDSTVVSTRRAAAQLLAGMPELAEPANAILLAWIAEEPPPDFPLLVEACKSAKLAETGPWLRKVLEAPDTPPQTFAIALAALAPSRSPDLAEIVKKRLADPKEDPTRIEACIEALEEFPNLPADELLLPWLRQRDARVVRLKAVFAIRDPAAHRAVLLDRNETDSILQRNCLYRLMESLDDAALLELLRDPRVTRHSYFAIRVDVCTALACVEGAGAPDVPLLLDYLVDEDAQDKTHIVRAEAWLTLWTLTGEMRGAQGDFAKPPPRGGREFRGRRGQLRDGVGPELVRELERLAKDLEHMRTVRAAYAA